MFGYFTTKRMHLGLTAMEASRVAVNKKDMELQTHGSCAASKVTTLLMMPLD